MRNESGHLSDLSETHGTSVWTTAFRPKRVPGESRFVCRPRSSDPLTTLNAALSGALGGATYRRLEQRASKVTRKEAIKLSIGLIVVLNVGLAAGMLVLLAGAMRLPYRLRAEPRGPQPPQASRRAGEPTQASRAHGPAQARGNRARLFEFVTDVANRPRDAGGRLVHCPQGVAVCRKASVPSKSAPFHAKRRFSSL